MRLFLILSITLISLSLNAQIEDYSLFHKNAVYTVSNDEFSIDLKIYQKNKKLIVETNSCIDCYDIKQPFYTLKLKEIRKDFFYFYIKSYYFVLDLSYKAPRVIILNPSDNNIKNPLLL